MLNFGKLWRTRAELGVSSPPRVCAVPVKRELGPRGPSPLALGNLKSVRHGQQEQEMHALRRYQTENRQGLLLRWSAEFSRTDQELLKQGKEVSDGHASYSPVIWNAVVQNLDHGNLAKAKAALKLFEVMSAWYCSGCRLANILDV